MAKITRQLVFDDTTTVATDQSDESEKEQHAEVLPKEAQQKKRSYEEKMIEAIAENDPNRKGVSFASIKKFIQKKYELEGNIGTYVKNAFEKLTAKEVVERVKGIGMTGSIRFTKKYVEGGKKQEKLALKAKKKEAKAKAKAEAKAETKQKRKDKNNNDRKQKSMKKQTGKANETKAAAASQGKQNPKKTVLTKTKIDRSNGKVRLSIGVAPTPGPSKAKPASKAKANGKQKKAAAAKLPSKKASKETQQ